jgi:hypothetical protein
MGSETQEVNHNMDLWHTVVADHNGNTKSDRAKHRLNTSELNMELMNSVIGAHDTKPQRISPTVKIKSHVRVKIMKMCHSGADNFLNTSEHLGIAFVSHRKVPWRRNLPARQ